MTLEKTLDCKIIKQYKYDDIFQMINSNLIAFNTTFKKILNEY